MTRLGLLLLAAASLLAAAAGCGGAGGGDTTGAGGNRLSKAEYQERLSDFGTELAKAFGSLGRTPTTVAGRAAYYEKLADGWDAVAKTLEGINAPAEIDEAHRKLAGAARSMADDLHDAAARAGPRLLNPSTLSGFKQIQAALKAIGEQGYSFESETVTTTAQSG